LLEEFDTTVVGQIRRTADGILISTNW